MKLQYLGDSKDSFKWDYHGYLTSKLACQKLNIILMLTPDDNTRDGRTHPELFPARTEIISFCHELRRERDVQLLRGLPRVTRASYVVDLHRPGTYYARQSGREYFSELSSEGQCLFFLDPDNGFEPETSNDKHVLYADVAGILKLMPGASVISVFQHFRRIPFEMDFARIKQHLAHLHVSAVYWHFLMFVTVAKTKSAIERVVAANYEYSRRYPVRVLPCVHT
jgi:hypothetical protein